jgi:hypothetical protein
MVFIAQERRDPAFSSTGLWHHVVSSIFCLTSSGWWQAAFKANAAWNTRISEEHRVL